MKNESINRRRDDNICRHVDETGDLGMPKNRTLHYLCSIVLSHYDKLWHHKTELRVIRATAPVGSGNVVETIFADSLHV